ncbi:MAG TPA: hydrogen gas-evolving membrane-bound hydrogenase subunit E [Ilumatobacteraceae bacterium]|nr:hydrogen gas-evolving membrane-bound hydrogenase subunit E [Ilumatobacteraceae bacterium]
MHPQWARTVDPRTRVVIALLVLHLAVGVLLVTLARRGATRPGVAFAAAALPSAATFGWLLAAYPDVLDGGVRTAHVEWIPELGVDLDLRLDGFAALMLLLVAGIGVLVVAYAWRYFSHPTPADVRLAGLLVLFAGAMVGLVLADDLLVLYGFWELTSITSFLLIGNRHEDPTARAAALQALLITGFGALAMLAGFIVLGQAAGTYQLSAILADPPSGTAVTVAIVLILLGAFTKSAQVPFHSWLPGAMAAPTPVSTYLHSATMVKAGVYLVARLAPAFVALDLWRPLVESVGAATMVVGGLRALRQHDLKLLLAYGTVSQLGFMIAVFGWGTPAALTAGCVMLLAHGAFKAAGFMVVGILDHQHGTRDLRKLPRPSRGWTPTVVVTAVAAASMAGIPMLFGFIAKEADFATFVDQGRGAAITLTGLVVGSALTAAYSLRFIAGAVGRLADPEIAAATADASHGPPAPWFVVPGAVLSAVTIVFGVVPGLADRIVTAGARALDPVTAEAHLELWHGINIELLLSALALAAGAVLYIGRRRVGSLLAYGSFVPPSSGAYLGALRGVNVVSNRVTAITQPGSLPIYLGVILLTAALVPGALLVSGTWWPGWPDLVEVPMHVPIAALLIGLALAAAIVRRRFAGALFLGMVGYSMAGLFVTQGAPDLALTQVAIETLSTVLFVLVLRRLPDRFETTRGAARRTVRIVIATIVGGLVFVFTLAVGGIQPETDVADVMVAQAYPEGEGRNVVNVILVDIRGFDTLGEITVLTAVAIGTVALARAGRRPPRLEAEAARAAPERRPAPVMLTRLVTIEVSVRIVFAAVMLGSLWLLFAGHNQPGGGFVGGIVAGAAISLVYVSGGLREVRRLSRGKPWMVLGAGLLISVTTAIIPLLLGGAVLQTGSHTFDLPVIGEMKVTSALFFDIGVYLAVIGLAMMVFESFGDDPRPPARSPTPATADTPAEVTT